MKLPQLPPQLAKRLFSKKGRRLLAALAVGGIGLSCYLLPTQYQAPCKLCFKVASFALGVP